MQRITLTIDDEVAKAARHDVEAGRAPSLSAWVSDAMQRKALGRIRLELELDELRQATPYSAEDIAWAAEVLDGDTARSVGARCAVAGVSDVVDGHIAHLVEAVDGKVITSDASDLERLGVPAEPITVV